MEQEFAVQRALPEDYAATFNHASGQRVLHDLWLQFWGEHTLYNPGIPALDLAFREGQRSVVIMIKAAALDAMYLGDDATPVSYPGPRSGAGRRAS